jgi:O-antigen/teichoic acid export membrane protein
LKPSLLKGSTYYSLANLIPQSLAFLVLPLYSKYMSVSDYGIVSAMETLAIALSAFICLSLDKAGHRLYFEHKKEGDKKRFLSSLYIASLVITAFIFTCLLVARPLLQLLFDSIEFYPFFLVAILNVSLNVFSLIPTMFFQVSEQPKKYMYLRISRFSIQILLVLYLVVFREMGAFGHLVAELIGLIIFLPVYVLISARNFGFKFEYSYLKGVFSFALPLIPTLLMAWVLSLSDRVFIEQFLDLTALGTYSMGYRLSMIYLLITGSIMLAYTPFFYRSAGGYDSVEKSRLLNKLTVYLVHIFLLLYFLVSLFLKELVDVFLDDSYKDIHAVGRLLLVGHCISAIMSVSSGLSLLNSKRTMVILFVAFLAATVNILLNFYVINLFGIAGAAYSSIVSTCVLFLLQYLASRQGYFINIPILSILSIFLFFSITLIGFHFYLEKFYFLSLVLKVLILGCLIFVSYKFYPRIVRLLDMT